MVTISSGNAPHVRSTLHTAKMSPLCQLRQVQAQFSRRGSTLSEERGAGSAAGSQAPPPPERGATPGRRTAIIPEPRETITTDI